MRNIIPTQQTTDGLFATQLIVTVKEENLESEATFRWQLLSELGEFVNMGEIPCATTNYLYWKSERSGDNEFPYEFVANTINLEII